MNQIIFKFFTLFIGLVLFIGCQQDKTSISNSIVEPESMNPAFAPPITDLDIGGKIVIANRGSGSISVIDVNDDVVTGSYPLPESDQPAQPMYVVYNLRNRTVFVGDRGNDRIVAFDANDFSVNETIEAGSGVFHMWSDPRGKQLWVNNDVSKNMTVIDPRSFSVITTIDMPADLEQMGGKPHDVILDPRGEYAYVTFLGFAGESDYVVQYSTRTFTETGRAAVGKDPHLSLTQKNNLLYVPCQNSNSVYILGRNNMKIMEVLDVPGAHGAGMALNGRTFYTTNLPGGGPAGLWSIDVQTNSVLAHTDTPFPVPHNIALTPQGRKLYITHSGGTADKVSVYTIPKGKQVPEFYKEVTVGLNPFGLSYAN